MILISRDDVQDMLNETEELSAYTFKILDEKLAKIEVRAVYRECDGCFGASMGDCSKCRRFVITGKVAEKLSVGIDKFDKYIEAKPQELADFMKMCRYKIFGGKHRFRK